jgi:hypothetical protein
MEALREDKSKLEVSYEYSAFVMYGTLMCY